MAQVTFAFDKEQDMRNIWKTCNDPIVYGKDFLKGISPKIIDSCKGKSFEDCKQELEKINSKLYSSKVIRIFMGALKKSWGLIEKEYFNRLGALTGKKFNEKISCYITTISRCPYHYGKNEFMVSLFSSLPNALKTCGHEIMHLHFHKFYFENLKSRVGQEKAHDIKEALTVLLNLEFKDLWFAYDEGYEKHKGLREFISLEWKKEKDFEKLLEKCVSQSF